MFNTKLLVPIALGLSLVTVTAFVVYHIFKKDEETEGKSIKTSRVNIIEINVPKSIVPALIGRSGSNIKDIEKRSGALINFKKFTDKEYDVCIIRGRNEATQLAETLVHDFIKQQPDIAQEQLTVPGWACGRIIGAGGENINEISHRSGARVRVEGLPARDNSTQRCVSLRGTAVQIATAKKLIDACVAHEKCRREIEQSKRSPRHAPPAPAAPPAPSAPSAPPAPPAPPAASDGSDDSPEASGSGASIEVYVSAVSSPSRFWVQLVGPQVAQLDELVDTMTEYYGDRSNRDSHALKAVCVGQVVAAVFRHDGRWYRARVHDIRPNEFDATHQVADVFYVDYGDSEYVATHELCELRADLLRLRFQAMECFLAGVRPAGREEDVSAVSPAGHKWDRWHPHAVERFEELTQVARWRALVSRTCTYRKAAGVGGAGGDGDKEKEIPGIKLFDVTEEGELDIGGALVEEGWAVAAPAGSPRATPPPAPRPPAPSAPSTPFGDLGNSMVLSMLGGAGGGAGGRRSSSVPKDHKDDRPAHPAHPADKDADRMMTSSQSVGAGLAATDKPKSISNFNISYPEPAPAAAAEARVNGSHDLLTAERRQGGRGEEREQGGGRGDSTETLVPAPGALKAPRDEAKANMNRINSHHGNLESLGKSLTDLHKH